MKDLMDEFVCVRLVKANDLDLNLFQFDFDMTFAVFFINADGALYGRYGTRSHNREAAREISIPGFRAALEGAIALHRKYPANKASLAGKRKLLTRHDRPREYEKLKKFGSDLDYGGNVVRSCVHCHQIGDAERLAYRERGQPVPDRALYPYPMPEVVGLDLDADTRGRVAAVAEGSAAGRAGFVAGDEILTLADQPILSIADVQWVLHSSDAPASLEALVARAGQNRRLTLRLDEGWRAPSDISWRVSTWDLRRMVLGGLVLETLDPAVRREAGVRDGKMALRVKHVGQYGDHAVAKRAGFKKGDIVVEFDGRSDDVSESSLITRAVNDTRAGRNIEVDVLRGGRTQTLKLRMR